MGHGGSQCVTVAVEQYPILKGAGRQGSRIHSLPVSFKIFCKLWFVTVCLCVYGRVGGGCLNKFRGPAPVSEVSRDGAWLVRLLRSLLPAEPSHQPSINNF